KITTRSYLIKDGKVRTHGTPSQIVRDPIAINEYLGSEFNDDTYDDEPAWTRNRPAAPPLETGLLLQEGPSFAETGPAGDSRSPLVPATVEYAAPAPKGNVPALQAVLEQEKIQRWVEGLKTPDHAHAAAELVQRGVASVSALLSALERRDVELRRQALHV